MIPSNPICQVCDYGSSAVYRELPSEEQIRCGVIPLDSLPAAWWNCMWNMTNGAVNQARSAVGVLIDEVNTVLDRAGVCVCDTCVDQLYQSIDKISQIVGTASRAGSVKSSATCGEVSINSNGIMTANGLGNASQLTTTAHTAIGAINELKSTYDSCWSANTTALNGKAPTSHASSGASYGVGSASNYGHLKISDTYTSVLAACSGVAASQKALACVYQYASDVAAAALGLGNTAGCALGTAAAGTATTAARSDHVHPLPAITSLSGTLAIAHGGTGATCAAGARTNLGLGTAATCAATAFLAAAGCAVDSNKFAGCTYACAKADILSGNAATATNATCFGGCTYAQAKADILSGNAATATNATCFGGCTYAQAKANILTGCAADSAKFAGCTYAQAKANILTGCAADSAKFAGCTYACAKANILSGNAASATNATCFGGCTYDQAKADIRNYTPANATNAVNSTCFGGCTYAQAKTDMRSGLAPTSHASAETTYGIGTTANYGHLKICDTYTANCADAAAGVAASQKAVYNAYNAGRNFGNTASYSKFVCAAAAEAAAADCVITLGLARSYRWCACTTNICSFDRRTYSKLGTYQCQNACAGFAYLDVCSWQCCYSGTAGVTTCSNKRYCFHSNGYFLPPVGVCGSRVYGKNATFGCALITDRLADIGSAAVTFARCGTILGHIGMSAVGGALSRFTANGAASYQLLDTSAAVTVAQGGTGATTAANARTNLGLGTAATYACTAFLAAAGCAADSAKLGGTAAADYLLKTGCAADSAKLTGKAPSALCVACAGANGSGTAFGDSATRGVFTRTAVGDIGWGTAANRTKVVDVGAMAYWDGTYQNTNSNLRYYCGGAFGSAAGKTAGSAAGNVPLVGTALGTTDKNIVVTDTAGKLKPSGTVIGSAAGKTAGSAAGNVPLINATDGLGTTDNNILVTDANGNLKASGTTLGSAAGYACTAFLAASGCATDSAKLAGKAPSTLCVACAGKNGSGTAFGSAATVNTGTAANCIPLIGTALGSTDKNIVVTDTNGKLKPSGTVLGSAAGCAASAFLAAAGCATDSAKLAGCTPATLCVCKAGCASQSANACYASCSHTSFCAKMANTQGVYVITRDTAVCVSLDLAGYCYARFRLLQSSDLGYANNALSVYICAEAGYMSENLTFVPTGDYDGFEFQVLGQASGLCAGDSGAAYIGMTNNQDRPHNSRWVGGWERTWRPSNGNCDQIMGYMGPQVHVNCSCFIPSSDGWVLQCLLNYSTCFPPYACRNRTEVKHMTGIFYRTAMASSYKPTVLVRALYGYN